MKLLITPQLSTLIKTLRVQNGVSAKDLAAHIHMSPSYVSKLEGGSVRYIEKELLTSILCFVTCSEDFYGVVLPAATNLLMSMIDKVHLVDEIWLLQYDVIDRQVEVSVNMAAELKQIMEKNGITKEAILTYANSNIDSELNSDFPANEYVSLDYEGTRRLLIRVYLTEEAYDLVLNPSSNIATAPYSVVHQVVYAITRLTISSDIKVKLPANHASEALYQTSIFMDKWNIHSLVGMSHFLSSDEFIQHQLPLANRKTDALSCLVEQLQRASEYDSLAVSTQLSALSRTMEWDAAFALRLIGINFAALGDMSHTNKVKLLNDIEALIQKYDQMSDYEKNLEAY